MGLADILAMSALKIAKLNQSQLASTDVTQAFIKTGKTGNLFDKNSKDLIRGQALFSGGGTGVDATKFISPYIDISDPSNIGKLIRVASIGSSAVTYQGLVFYDENKQFLEYGYYQPPIKATYKYVRFSGPLTDLGIFRMTIDAALQPGQYSPYGYIDADKIYKNNVPVSNMTFKSALKSDYPIITLIDDDGYATFNTVVKPVLDAYSYKCSLAIVSSWIGTAGFLTVADLQALQTAGFEMLSHSKTHAANLWRFDYVRDNIDEAALRAECKESFEFLRNNGLETDTLVYPYGSFDYGYVRNRMTAICKDYYDFGLSTAVGIMSDDVLNNMYLNRVQINMSVNDLAYYKGLVDSTIANKGWLILFCHSNSTTEVNSTFLTDLFAYINSKGVAVRTFKDANAVKKNICSIGTFDRKSGSLFIGRSGVIKNN